MRRLTTAIPAALAACACASAAAAPPQATAAAVHVNQAGYRTVSPKLAIVTDSSATRAEVVDDAGEVVFSAGLSPASEWPPAGQTVRHFDFSALTAAGRYRIRGDRGGESPPFRIADTVLSEAALLAQKSFYFLRSGTALPPEFAGPWQRAAGHPDTEVRVHPSAAGPGRPAGTIVSAPGGWYDAGDYNKYAVNASFATYLLLVPFDACPGCFADGDVAIPESGNGRPDLLDEARFNLDWLLAMQDPADGGVYHKLTSRRFSGFVMPAADRSPRFVVGKSTAAALDFSAVTAFAARLFDESDPGYGAVLESAAKNAWSWALRNPHVPYEQPDDVVTGAYAEPADELLDEWGWARVELFLLTGDESFLNDWSAAGQPAGVPSWDHVIALAWLSIAREADAPAALRDAARAHVLRTADRLVDAARAGYRVSMHAYDRRGIEGQSEADYAWGSNGMAAAHAVVLAHAYDLTADPAYLDVAVSAVDYLFGRNPLGMSFVTGSGTRSPLDIHHRPSVADGVREPVPGLLAGGPNPGQQDRDDCNDGYASDLPALSYLDDVCSYASNENAINWNAALVAALFLVDRHLAERQAAAAEGSTAEVVTQPAHVTPRQ